MDSTLAARPASFDTAGTRWRGLLAAIDMGSNSFRLELGQLDGVRYRRSRLPERNGSSRRRDLTTTAC